jgi:hypothetical protein
MAQLFGRQYNTNPMTYLKFKYMYYSISFTVIGIFNSCQSTLI